MLGSHIIQFCGVGGEIMERRELTSLVMDEMPVIEDEAGAAGIFAHGQSPAFMFGVGVREQAGQVAPLTPRGRLGAHEVRQRGEQVDALKPKVDARRGERG